MQIEHKANEEFQRSRGNKGSYTLMDCIGKIVISDNTDPNLTGVLMDTNPHTLKINGKYV